MDFETVISNLKRTNSHTRSGESYFLINGDSLKLLNKIPDNSIDLIVTDPPYFLSNNGVTCKSGKMVSVNKGQWDKLPNVEEVDSFNYLWLKESQRILSPTGSIWISGTNHNIFSIGYLMRHLGFKILNTITWVKKSPPPNLSCRYFTHSTETIIWGRKNEKSKHKFNYDSMKRLNGGKQMKDVWEIGRTKKEEKKWGYHPTQKPEELIERMILSSSNEGDIVLDMFCGSGTTGSMSGKNLRKFIGIDTDLNYLETTEKRILNV